MNRELQFNCLDEYCRTVLIHKGNEHLTDGLNCPRCGGPVVPNPYEAKRLKVSERAFYVREKILERSLKNCRDLTPEQVDAILSIGDEYIKEPLLLQIALDSESSVPKVFYKGEEINLKKEILFHWESKDSYSQGGLTYIIENGLKGQGVPTINRIERRIKDHACD